MLPTLSKIASVAGLIVKTSINTDIQKTLDAVLIRGLIMQDKKNGWRGVIGKNKKLINFDKLISNKKNPFPDKWFYVQIRNGLIMVSLFN